MHHFALPYFTAARASSLAELLRMRASISATALRAHSVFLQFVFMTCTIFFCLFVVIPNGSENQIKFRKGSE